MSWTAICQDSGDGSGDLFVELPDDLLKTMGWTTGDTLELEAGPEGSFVIRLTKKSPSEKK